MSRNPATDKAWKMIVDVIDDVIDDVPNAPNVLYEYIASLEAGRALLGKIIDILHRGGEIETILLPTGLVGAAYRRKGDLSWTFGGYKHDARAALSALPQPEGQQT